MQMQKTPRLLRQSIIMMEFMSGEDKMLYLQRMWGLYVDVYMRTPVRGRGRKRKNDPIDKRKAYELCSELTKIFGH